MDVQFYPNDQTNLHCVQATFRMILSKLLPDRQFSMEDLIKISAVVDGKATWPSRMLVELDNLGLDVVMVEGFNAQRFINEGADYLRDEFGAETAAWQIEHSNIEKERRDYEELLVSDVKVENRIPKMDDIKNYLDNGYMVKATVNSKKLAGKDGYTGHSVLVLAIDGDEVTLHNPGLPPIPNQHVSLGTFEASWSSPNDQAREIIAVRLKVT